MFPYGFSNFNVHYWAPQIFLTGFLCFLQLLWTDFGLPLLGGDCALWATLAVRLHHQLCHSKKSPFPRHWHRLWAQPCLCLSLTVPLCSWVRGGGLHGTGWVSLRWYVRLRILSATVSWSRRQVQGQTVCSLFFCPYFFFQLIKWFLMMTRSQIFVGRCKPWNRYGRLLTSKMETKRHGPLITQHQL